MSSAFAEEDRQRTVRIVVGVPTQISFRKFVVDFKKKKMIKVYVAKMASTAIKKLNEEPADTVRDLKR